MADAGVISLDPVRLSGLEVYLEGLGDGCRRRAARVAEGVAGSGLSAAQPVAELDRIAAACHRERDEVAWRRALVEAMAHDLPLPTLTYATREAAVAAAESLADDVIAALEDHPPRWSRLVRLLRELDRSAPSPPFASTFLLALGPARARQLPLVVERAWRQAWVAPVGPDGRPLVEHPTEAEAAVVVAVQTGFARAVRTASRVRGAGALGDLWCRAYAGLPTGDEDLAAVAGGATAEERSEAERVERVLRGAGYGAGLAGRVAEAVGWRRAAAALGVDRGLLGLVAAPLDLADGDGIACDGPEVLLGAASAGITIVGAVVPGAALPAAVGGAVLTGLAALFAACEPQARRRNETRPTVDPTTGQSRLPSGHQTNPHVDEAGVPLPPSYG